MARTQQRRLELVISGDAAGAQRALNQVDRQTGGLSQRFGGLAKSIGVGVAGAATVGGAALVGLGANAIGAAQGVETGLREVNTLFGLTGEAAERSFKDLQSGVAGLSSEVGIAQEEITGGLYSAISAGVPRDNAFEFMEVASKAATAGVTDIETSVDGLSSIINAFGLDASDAGAVADSMFAAVQGGKTTFEELSSSIFNIAPAAAAAGVSMEEINAGIATLTSAGTPTSVATTQMRAALTGLQRPSDELNGIFQALGYESAQMAIESEGLGFALGAVSDAAAGDQGELQKLLGSVEAVAAANTIAGTGAEKFAEEMDRQTNSAGATNTAFEEMEKGSGRSMERLQVALNNVAVRVGSSLLPILEKAVTAITPILEGAAQGIGVLADAFDEGGFSGMISKVGDMITDAWPSIRDALGNIATGLLEWIVDTAPKVAEQLADWAAALVEWVGPQIPPLLDELGRLVGQAGEWVLDEGLPLLAEKLTEWGTAFVEWVGPQIPPLLAELFDLLGRVGMWIISDALPAIGEKLLEWGGAFVDWVRDPALPALMAALGDLLSDVGSWLVNTAAPAVGNAAMALAGSIWSWVTDAIASAPSRLWDLFTSITGWLLNTAPGLIADAVRGMWDPIATTFKGALNVLIGAWNSLEFKLPDFDGLSVAGQTIIPGFTGPTLGVPDIPLLADGGVITAPTLALLGETARARPEIAAPAPMLRQIIGDELRRHRPAGGAQEVVVRDLHVTVEVDGRAIAEKMIPHLRIAANARTYEPVGVI